MDIAVRLTGQAPKFIHFAYGANGVWEEAGGTVVGEMNIYRLPESYVEGLRITGWPVPFVDAVPSADKVGLAYNCATAVLKALYRGWGG